MNHLQHLRSRGWLLPLVAMAFVAGHLILFHVLRRAVPSHVTLTSTVVAGVVILIVAKHLGLLAGLFRYVITFLRRRFRSQ
jgi:hypothetical protein